MESAAAELEFERAAKYRNRLWALAHVTADQSINPEGIEEADVFAAYQDGGQTCVQVFFFRTGQNWGNRAYFPKADRSLSVEEILDSFVAQFYDDKPVPRLVLLSHDIPNREVLAEALSAKAERRVEVRVPHRGRKTGLVEHALSNAKEALGRKLAESSSQRRLLDGVATAVVEVHEDDEVDLATALHGSGPAYVYLLIESMVDAAVRLGMKRAEATELVLATVAGAARYAIETGRHPAELRNAVTSPGGTTAAALAELEAAGLRAAIDEAIEAAYLRALDLGES